MNLDQLNLVLNYNPNTGEFLRKNGKKAGTINSCGYVTIIIDGKNYKGQDLAWTFNNGEKSSKFIVHKNRIKSDNRKSNLEESDKRLTRDLSQLTNSGKLIGAYYRSHLNKWQSIYSLEGKYVHLGYFTTEIEAHETYLRYYESNKF